MAEDDACDFDRALMEAEAILNRRASGGASCSSVSYHAAPVASQAGAAILLGAQKELVEASTQEGRVMLAQQREGVETSAERGCSPQVLQQDRAGAVEEDGSVPLAAQRDRWGAAMEVGSASRERNEQKGAVAEHPIFVDQEIVVPTVEKPEPVEEKDHSCSEEPMKIQNSSGMLGAHADAAPSEHDTMSDGREEDVLDTPSPKRDSSADVTQRIGRPPKSSSRRPKTTKARFKDSVASEVKTLLKGYLKAGRISSKVKRGC
ncbi:MAG: hypothetical protein SGPRY_002031 [Prymnesium sp.]